MCLASAFACPLRCETLEEKGWAFSSQFCPRDVILVERGSIFQAEAKKWFDDESDSEDGDSDEDDSSDEEAEAQDAPPAQEGMKIQDQTDTNLINLRRTIYLTIMSSMDFEEAGHKLMKIELRPGQEMEIVTMIIECCSQEKTYLR